MARIAVPGNSQDQVLVLSRSAIRKELGIDGIGSE
jgi:hypothetical protein